MPTTRTITIAATLLVLVLAGSLTAEPYEVCYDPVNPGDPFPEDQDPLAHADGFIDISKRN